MMIHRSCKYLQLIVIAAIVCLIGRAQNPAPVVEAQTGKTPSARDVRPLLPGASMEREIAGGGVHSYGMQMVTGQYARVAIDPRSAVLSVKLFAPDGAKLLEVLMVNTAQEPTRISLIAQPSGQYLIELSPAQDNAPSRRYAIGIEDLRPATTDDQDRVTAEALFAEANSLTAAGRAEALQAAIKKYRAALDLWRKMGERREEAGTLLRLGSVSHNLSRLTEALDYYNQALPIWKALGDRAKEAQTLSGMGWTYYSIGELQKALQNYNLALPIRRALQDLRGQAQTLTTIGQIYRSLGEPQLAMEQYNQALPLARQAGDKVQEAFALNNYAYLDIDLGEYQKALDYLEQALPLWRETGNRYGEADALNSEGIVYHNLSDFEKALEYYERALELWRFVGARGGEADALNNIGSVYWSQRGSAQKAIDYLNQALALRRAIGQRLGEADTLNNLGLVYEELDERDRALDYFMRALAIDSGHASTLSNICRNYYLRGDYKRALEFCNQSLVILRDKGDKTGEAGTLGMMAKVQSTVGNLDEALANGKNALDMFEKVRAGVVAPELRTSFQSFSMSYYDLLIEILAKLHKLRPTEGHDAAALEISERARARGLLELLGEGHIDVRRGVEPTLLERERTLQRLLNAKEHYRTRLIADKRADAERAAVEKELSSLIIEYQNTLSKIHASSPKYAALTQPATLSLKQIQRDVLDEETVLLEYHLGQSDFLWAVTPTSISMHPLPDRTEIEAVARRVYDSLIARNNHPPGETPEQRLARINKADAEYDETSAALSQILLGPVASKLGKKRLVFVTEGLLQYIPFGALPAPTVSSQLSVVGNGARDHERRTADKHKPLIADHEIVNLPSASVLAVLRKEFASRKAAAKSVVIIADPVFNGEDPRVEFKPMPAASSSQRAGKSLSNDSRVDRLEDKSGISNFGRLRFSREEADNIAELAPRSEVFKATDFAAKKEMVITANLEQYRILHFATHSLLNTRWPELSSVVLSLVDERGEPQDGFLRLNEIYNLRLNADLVVLSGCQTALGKEIKGEGLVGLTRGFMYAGAPRVIASLWSVDDRATAELMKRFYKAVLTERMHPAAALRAAQIGLLSEKGWTAPYYWAAFSLQGEWK
jgi:CHAT domain-containing protein/Tfp pilus assembly protein PilF